MGDNDNTTFIINIAKHHHFRYPGTPPGGVITPVRFLYSVGATIRWTSAFPPCHSYFCVLKCGCYCGTTNNVCIGNDHPKNDHAHPGWCVTMGIFWQAALQLIVFLRWNLIFIKTDRWVQYIGSDVSFLTNITVQLIKLRLIFNSMSKRWLTQSFCRILYFTLSHFHNFTL